jgi:hypothetical protein
VLDSAVAFNRPAHEFKLNHKEPVMVKHKDSSEPRRNEPDANRDPITGTPGAHPLGVGAGAATGGLAGAAVGAIGGPVGAGIGAAVGAVAGGLVGKGAAEAVNPTVEDEYWRENYTSRDYIDSDSDYEEYKPAYQYGWESYSRYGSQGKSFDDVSNDLERDWRNRRGESQLEWDNAKPAVRDAWDRVESCRIDRRGPESSRGVTGV